MPYGRDAQGKSGRSMSCADEINLKRSKNFSFLNLRPILALKHPKTLGHIVRFIPMFRLYAVSAIGVVICFPLAYKSDSAVSQSLLSLDLLVETVISNLLWSGRLSGCLGREVGEEEQECSSGGDEDLDDVSSSTRGRCRAIALGCQN
ncbi:hypothetical protein CISG_04319 [Coccidioides immitis RMSCC 3703]|uniref:Uncharacterized protein n=2 Tax=Coccidioides immitis TaxID=5501 RepID=A0A0J8TLS9_COCIT|nr:hypothetical protein CIRG_02368 [Coccidioides immitis RMSCC 2394]KMU74612.1 hypothetical protein CISG_04319 [Coccidioides immitis RMSCC 3703]